MGYDASSSKQSENALGDLLLCWRRLPLSVSRQFYPNGCCFAFIKSVAVLCPITSVLGVTPVVDSFLEEYRVLASELSAVDGAVCADAVYVLCWFPQFQSPMGNRAFLIDIIVTAHNSF